MGISSMSMIGAGMNAVGSMEQVQGQQGALNYESGVMSNNQQLAEYQSQIAEHNGQIEEQNTRLKGAMVMGAQRAAMGANGIDMNYGSGKEQLQSTHMMTERDALTIEHNTQNEVWALQQQAKGYGNNAQILSSEASNINPLFTGASSLLTDTGSIARQWYMMNNGGG